MRNPPRVTYLATASLVKATFVTAKTTSEDEAVSKDTDSEVAGVDSQLHRVDNEDAAVAEDADSEVPGGEGVPGAEREAALKWLWIGIPFTL